MYVNGSQFSYVESNISLSDRQALGFRNRNKHGVGQSPLRSVQIYIYAVHHVTDSRTKQ